MATGNFFDGEFVGGGYFGALVPPVPPPTVNYQGEAGGSSGPRKKRRNRTKELFDDIEATIRTLVHGPAPAAPVILSTEQSAVVIDRRTEFVEALRHLDRLASDSRALSLRVQRLRLDMQRTLDEDEDEAMMVLL